MGQVGYKNGSARLSIIFTAIVPAKLDNGPWELNENSSGMRRVSFSYIPRRTDNNVEALLQELAASRGSLETLGGLRDPKTTAAKWYQTLTVDFGLQRPSSSR